MLAILIEHSNIACKNITTAPERNKQECCQEILYTLKRVCEKHNKVIDFVYHVFPFLGITITKVGGSCVISFHKSTCEK